MVLPGWEAITCQIFKCLKLLPQDSRNECHADHIFLSCERGFDPWKFETLSPWWCHIFDSRLVNHSLSLSLIQMTINLTIPLYLHIYTACTEYGEILGAFPSTRFILHFTCWLQSINLKLKEVITLIPKIEMIFTLYIIALKRVTTK